jgi:hypothetical protein
MFERFRDSARRVDHNSIGTEHLLLAMLDPSATPPKPRSGSASG